MNKNIRLNSVSLVLGLFTLASANSGENSRSVSISDILSLGKIHDKNHQNQNYRTPRAAHEILLSDPLDCLSQIICGLNTFPPQRPSARTSSSNDFAYLLRTVILRLKKKDETPKVNGTSKPDVIKPPLPPKDKQQDDDDSDESNEDDVEEDDTSDENRKKPLKISKDQHGDFVHMKDLYPPFGLFGRRDGRAKKVKNSVIKRQKDGTEEEPKGSKARSKIHRKNHKTSKGKKESTSSTTPFPIQTALDRLRMEKNIRVKLRSNAQCMYGILQHSCPFKYGELMVLTSAVLERQKAISYSSNKILPMVGYLLKSQSLTQTLKSTFYALEKINNITITKDNNKEPITFSHIYEEIIHGDTGGNGIQIVETKNDAANSHAWEDDEFDEALRNPFLPKESIPGFNIKKKPTVANDESQEDISEDEENKGVIPGIIPSALNSPFEDDSFPTKFQEEHDDESDDNAKESTEDIPLPPLYGIHLNKKKHVASKPANSRRN